MRKKGWLSVVALVGVVAALTMGGAVIFANDSTGDSPPKSFASRVATILGLSEVEVEDAFRQARMELADERLQQKLDRLVEQGRLTPEQANEYREWFQSRPEGLSPGLLPGFPRRGFRGFGHGFHGRHQGNAPMPAPEGSGTSSL